MTTKKFFEIGQDGIGFIDNDNSLYSGLCTSGLETCMALVIKLNSGIVLVHDTGQLDFLKIKEFILSRGTVEDICSYEKEKNEPTIQDKAAILNNRQRRYLYKSLLGKGKILQQNKTPNGCVYVYKNFDVTTDGKDYIVEQLENYVFRHAINECNNAFSPNNCQNLLPDIQFDKEQVYTLPNLRYSRIKMVEMIDDRINAGDWYLDKIYTTYFENFEKAGNELDENKLSPIARRAFDSWLNTQMSRTD